MIQSLEAKLRTSEVADSKNERRGKKDSEKEKKRKALKDSVSEAVQNSFLQYACTPKEMENAAKRAMKQSPSGITKQEVEAAIEQGSLTAAQVETAVETPGLKPP